VKNILLITTIYRTGEKIYPIIPKLSKIFNVDVLHMFKMSKNTVIPKNTDYRGLFLSRYKSYIRNEYNGPKFVGNKIDDQTSSLKFINDRLVDIIRDNNYSLILFDNNVDGKGQPIKYLYKLFHGHGIPVVGSPHGNRDFPGYEVGRRLRKCYDYSFVFGEYERHELSMSKKCRKRVRLKKDDVYNRLKPCGIPSNDILKEHIRGISIF